MYGICFSILYTLDISQNYGQEGMTGNKTSHVYTQHSDGDHTNIHMYDKIFRQAGITMKWRGDFETFNRRTLKIH